MAVLSVDVVFLLVVVFVSSASSFVIRQSGIGSSPTTNSSTCTSLCACSAKDGTFKYLQTVLQAFTREKVPDFSPDPFYGNFYS
jgi:hypothetical protein